jgi:hypothetical protein
MEHNQTQEASVFEMTDAHWHLLQKSGTDHKHRYGHAARVSLRGGP